MNEINIFRTYIYSKTVEEFKGKSNTKEIEKTIFQHRCYNCDCCGTEKYEGDVKEPLFNDNNWFKYQDKLYCKYCYSYAKYNVIQLLDRCKLLYKNNNYGNADHEINIVNGFIYRIVKDMMEKCKDL